MSTDVHYQHAAGVTSSAIISDDGLYRYRLTRVWDGEKGLMTWVMLNPSTADATQDDPTIRRCMGFAKREGCGGIVVVNLFALRVTRPVHLFDKTIADDPEGRDNKWYVRRALADTDMVVAAWGANPRAEMSWSYLSVAEESGVMCLGTTADGSPRHPLYLRADAPLERWPL